MNDKFELEEQRLLRQKKKSSEAGNLQQLAETCRKLGDMYCGSGEHLKALNEYKLVAKAFQNLKMRMEVGRANRLVGEMFILLKEYKKALRYQKVYFDIAKDENDIVELQRAYATIGRTHLLKGQASENPAVAKNSLMEAEKAFVKGLRHCRSMKGVGRLEQSDMEARAILNLGLTKEYQGEWDEAVEFMENATKIAKSNDIVDLIHLCLVSTAQLFYRRLNNPFKALKMIDEALDIASKLSDNTSKMCETLLAKAEAIVKFGDFQRARKVLKTAYRMKTSIAADAENIERNLKILVAIQRTEDELTKIDSTDYAKKKLLNETLGDASCKLFNYNKAIEYYLKMLECAELSGETGRQLVPIYVSLYQTYKDNRQYKEALKYLWKEYHLIQDEPREAYNTLLTIGEIYEAQKLPFLEIGDIYDRVRKEAQKLQSLSLQRAPLKRSISILKKNDCARQAESLEQEAADLGIDLTLADNANLTDDSDDEVDESTIDMPDIGNDVNLDELSDSEEERLNYQTETQANSVPTLKRDVSFPIKRNKKGETQLHQACINGNKMLVQKLLEEGHPVNLRDHAGWLPIHEACNNGTKDIVEMLLDKGAHINDKGGPSCDGITPLYDACSNGNLEVVKLLLDRGANCLLRTESGDTTLNVLGTWFEMAQNNLTSENTALYNEIRDRMVSAFDKVCVKSTESEAIPDSMELKSRATHRSTRRQTNGPVHLNSDSGLQPVSTLGKSRTSKRKRLPEIQLNSSDEEQENGRKRSFREKGTSQQSPLKDPNPEISKRAARDDEIDGDYLMEGPSKKRQIMLSEPDYVETNERRNDIRGTSPLDTITNSVRKAVSTELATECHNSLEG